jgi:hypothetical protein
MIRKGIFYELGIPASEENAKELEEKITRIVGMEGADCAKTWLEVRTWLENGKLRNSLKTQLSE